MGATGGEQKKIKWGPGALGSKGNINTSMGATHTKATRHIKEGNCNKELKLGMPINLLDLKPIRGPNKILKGHVPLATKTHPPRVKRDNGKSTTPKTKGNGRALPRELLDNGQGKCKESALMANDGNSDMDISMEGTTEAIPQATAPGGHALLHPPIINTTEKIATGATMKLLRKQNKLLRNDTLREQPITCQWVRHKGDTLLGTEHWEQQTNTAECRLMALQGLAQKHEAADLLAD